MKTSLLFVAIVFAAVLSIAEAQNSAHGGVGSEHSGVAAHMHMDNRFAHNHPYYDRGYTFRGAPRDGYRIRHGGNDYWYDRGHWYRRRGGVSIVIGAPIGAWVPFLPFYYSTIWWRGIPYYYANDAYYTWDAGADEYEVTAPPDGIEAGGTTQPPASQDVYPKNGQSAEQQARDKYECHRSAVDQTGFDPTFPDGGVPAETAAAKRSDYQRAQAACLDARGYSVR